MIHITTHSEVKPYTHEQFPHTVAHAELQRAHGIFLAAVHSTPLAAPVDPATPRRAAPQFVTPFHAAPLPASVGHALVRGALGPFRAVGLGAALAT